MRSNGSILGKANSPTSLVASGRWSLYDNFLGALSSVWPGIGRTVIVTFTASGTWTCPTGVTEVEYLVVAGGGGGGGSHPDNVAGYAGNGGSGGSGIVIIKLNQ